MRLVLLLTAVALSTGIASAQEELPQINPGERKIPRKKDEGPRALALLKLTPDGKASLLPITIMINGKFWDATAYKADPVPMALDSGTVYEAERTGNSLGLFTIGGALHTKAQNVLSPWIATGAWAPAGSENKSTEHVAESIPVGIDNSDQPPRLTRDPSRLDLPAETSPENKAPASKQSGGSSSSDGPPRLTKPSEPAPSAAPASPAPGTPPSGSSSPPATSAPASAPNTRADQAKPPDSSNLPASDSGASDANRPRLRRGRPTQPLPDEEVPGYGKPGSEPSVSAAKSAAAEQGQFQLIPAISDAAGPEPHPFTFEWLKDEEGERRQQMTTLAKDQVRAYLAAQAKATISPAAATGQKTSRRAPAPKPPEPVFENVQMNAYDLWMSNQPVIVFSAEAHLPPAPTPKGQATPESSLQYSIMLVAYPDIYNNLHKLYVGVTDKYHLDLVPRLQLVDAVDADGDGRGELLFRETTDAGAGWVIYRATADKLWKMFDSLNPE